MGIYSLVFAGGAALGPSIGVLLQSSRTLPFFVSAAIGASAGLFLLAVFDNVVPTKRHALSYTGLLGWIWGPLLSVLCYALVEVTMLSLFPLYLTHIGLDRRLVSFLFSVYASGAVVSPLIAGVISDRFRRESVMIASAVLLLSGAVFVSFASGPAWLAITIAIMGLAAGAIYPVALSIIGDRTPAPQLGAANSLFTSAYSAGSIVGPFAIGSMMDIYGAQVLFTPLIVVSIAFVVVASADKNAVKETSLV